MSNTQPADNSDIEEHDTCPMTGTASCPADQTVINRCQSC